MAEYIEREALIALLKADMDFCYKELGDSPFSKGARTGLNAGINYATVIPAADVVEAKRGRWERLNYVAGWARCSNCESTWELSKIDAFNMDFCPNCGADMREEEKDDQEKTERPD